MIALMQNVAQWFPNRSLLVSQTTKPKALRAVNSESPTNENQVMIFQSGQGMDPVILQCPLTSFHTSESTWTLFRDNFKLNILQ